METSAKVYEITTQSVDATEEYWLAGGVMIVLLVLMVLCLIWQVIKGSKDPDAWPWRAYIGMSFMAAAGLGVGAGWMGNGIAPSVSEAVEHSIVVEVSESINLRNVTPINGDSVQDGFVAINSDGNTVKGEIVQLADNDNYRVTIVDFK